MVLGVEHPIIASSIACAAASTAPATSIGALAAATVLRPADVNAAAGLVPAGERPVDRFAVKGVQLYECRSEAGAKNGAEWVFVAPDAELIDALVRCAGKHYASAHWEAPDGSRIVGAVRARADAFRIECRPRRIVARNLLSVA